MRETLRAYFGGLNMWVLARPSKYGHSGGDGGWVSGERWAVVMSIVDFDVRCPG